MLSLIRKVAKAIYRTPGDLDDRALRRGTVARYALFAALVVASAVLAAPLIGGRFSEWRALKPTVALPRDSWQYLAEESAEAECEEAEEVLSRCLANPKNPKLWASTELRSDPESARRVEARVGKVFWLGTTIAPKILSEAHHREANQLALGWIRGGFRIWIDGQVILSGDKLDGEPIVLPIPLVRLFRAEPMRVAIRVDYRDRHPHPDLLNGEMGEGFFDARGATLYKTYAAFWSEIEPFSFFLLHLFLGLLFFGVWSSDRRKPEYFYMAAFLFFGALFRLRSLDLIFLSTSASALFALSTSLRFYEAAFGMFLGLAFARSRRSFFTTGVPLVVAAPAFFFFLAGERLPQGLVEQYANIWLDTGLLALGACACFVQGLYLSSEGMRMPLRSRRLVQFGLILAGLAALNASQSANLYSGFGHALFSLRFAYLVGVGLAARIVFADYREQVRLIGEAPVSEYHRRAALPEKVTGAILAVELKNAETLAAIWRSHMRAAIEEFSGTLLLKKGDGIVLLFDAEKCEQPALNAIRAFDAMRARALELEKQGLAEAEARVGLASTLDFRGGLTVGEVRPVWERQGRAREPYWRDAGATAPLSQAGRLLELEPAIGINEPSTNLIVDEALAASLVAAVPGLQRNFIVRARSVNDGHGNSCVVSAYVPLLAEVAPLRRAA